MSASYLFNPSGLPGPMFDDCGRWTYLAWRQVPVSMISQTAIARKLNLSQRTVSLCLAGSDRVADKTRERVLSMARKLGYRPNRSAVAMRTGRFNAVALVQGTNDGFSYLPGGLLVGLQQSLSRRGMHLVISNVPDEKLSDESYLPSVLREWSVDGFLLNYNYGFSKEIVAAVDNSHLPSIWLNTKRDHNCVYPDDLDAGRRITTELIQRGHRRIGFFSNRPFDGHFSVSDRYEGYVQEMTAAGLTPRKLYINDHDWSAAEAAIEYVRSFLSPADRPTAIVAYEVTEAMRTIIGALELGLRVPRDLSVATFHERPALHSGLPITTMHVPEYEIGNTALEQLLVLIEGNVQHVEPRSIKFSTMSGATVAPPPK